MARIMNKSKPIVCDSCFFPAVGTESTHFLLNIVFGKDVLHDPDAAILNRGASDIFPNKPKTIGDLRREALSLN